VARNEEQHFERQALKLQTAKEKEMEIRLERASD
jgi:hypothetical protein